MQHGTTMKNMDKCWKDVNQTAADFIQTEETNLRV
jgi:hypothetical protein